MKAWEGIHSFLTSALDGCGCKLNTTHAVCQEKNLWYLFNGRLDGLQIHIIRPIVIYDAEAWTLMNKI